MELAGAARSGCSAEAFGGDHFLPVEGDGGWQTRVDGGPAGAIIAVRPCDQHCTGAALAFRAAFLGTGQTLVAQEIEQAGVGIDAGEAAFVAVDG